MWFSFPEFIHIKLILLTKNSVKKYFSRLMSTTVIDTIMIPCPPKVVKCFLSERLNHINDNSSYVCVCMYVCFIIFEEWRTNISQFSKHFTLSQQQPWSSRSCSQKPPAGCAFPAWPSPVCFLSRALVSAAEWRWLLLPEPGEVFRPQHHLAALFPGRRLYSPPSNC